MNLIMKLLSHSMRLGLALALLTGLALTLAVPPVSANDDETQNATSGRTFGDGILSAYTAYYDADNSGDLSHEELLILERDRRNRLERPEQLWDTNRDGFVSDAEIAVARRNVRLQIEQHRSLRFDNVDTDRDGHLSLDEFMAINAVAARDGDTPGIGNNLFSNLDRDKDRRISKDEFLRRLDSITPQPSDGTPTPHPRQNINN